MRQALRLSILKLGTVGLATGALVFFPEANAMSAPARLLAIFSPEPLPPGYEAGKYAAFRGVLPWVVITGTVQFITLTPKGKLKISVAPNEQLNVVPKQDEADQSESHIVLAPGGAISPELIAKQ
jgi:hypothetical protein